MADRRPPYARTLAALRVLAWPYQYPPLSWVDKGIGWLAATNTRLAATVVVGVVGIVLSIVWKVTHG